MEFIKFLTNNKSFPISPNLEDISSKILLGDKRVEYGNEKKMSLLLISFLSFYIYFERFLILTLKFHS